MGLSTLKEKEIVLDTDGVERVIGEIAKQIQDAHPDLSTVALVGIHTNGVPLANGSTRPWTNKRVPTCHWA